MKWWLPVMLAFALPELATAQADDALAAANRLLAALHRRDTLERQIADGRQSYPQMFARLGINDPQLVTEYTDGIMNALEAGLDERLAAEARSYASHETADDLDAEAAFYETAAGQRLVIGDRAVSAEVAAITTDQMTQAIGKFIATHMPGLNSTK